MSISYILQHRVTSHAIMEESASVTTRVNVNEDILEMIVLNVSETVLMANTHFCF